ncbi:MAG: hypothetical protein RMK51_12230 [Meiothermus sp.]|uniref:COG1470 family protein n=1 Tax=Meiothermus sp. TaxID=1955249 RepID=UPI00298F22D3|nr:hypothetical protein [Meiothermus sp.]MDW8426693.1 hypothetical protein [Meiothermus sp.]
MCYRVGIAALALWLAACGGSGPQRPEPKLRPEARVLSAESRGALSSFTLTNAPACLDYTSPNRPLCRATLTFSADNPQLQQLAVGQVLVSEPTPAAPFGLLQRVKSISRSGNTLTVETEEANLGAVFEQGEFELEKTLAPSDLRSARALAQSVRFAGGVQVYSAQSGVRPLSTLDFSFDKVLYDQDGNASTTGDQVCVAGKVFFDVQSGVSAGLKGRIIPTGVRLKAALGMKFTAEVKVTAKLSKQVNAGKELASYNFAPITFFVGPVPIVLVPSLKVEASASGQVTLERTGSFSGPVSLSLVRIPSSLAVNGGFNPNPLENQSTLTPAASLAAGQYTLLVRAQASFGGHTLTRERALTLNVSASSQINLTGQVRNLFGLPLSGVEVCLGSRCANTDAQGRFGFTEVRPPYSLRVRPAATQEHTFVGLTRPDPVLLLFSGIGAPGEQSASLSGNLSPSGGPDLPQPRQHPDPGGAGRAGGPAHAVCEPPAEPGPARPGPGPGLQPERPLAGHRPAPGPRTRLAVALRPGQPQHPREVPRLRQPGPLAQPRRERQP